MPKSGIHPIKDLGVDITRPSVNVGTDTNILLDKIMDEEVMTLEEVAEYLRVHPSTIYRLLKKHEIPAFKVGSDWRFNHASIDRWCLELEVCE